MTRLFIIPRMFEFACSAIYAKYAKCAKCAMCQVELGSSGVDGGVDIRRSHRPSTKYQPQGLLQRLQGSSKPEFTFPSLDPVNGLPPPSPLFFLWLFAWPALEGFPPPLRQTSAAATAAAESGRHLGYTRMGRWGTVAIAELLSGLLGLR